MPFSLRSEDPSHAADASGGIGAGAPFFGWWFDLWLGGRGVMSGGPCSLSHSAPCSM